MRFHYPIFVVCEGTAEDKPCTHGIEGAGAVGVGTMRISDCGPVVGRADQMTPPEGWHPFRVKAPAIRRSRERVSPMSSPWAMAAATGEDQMAVNCPKCSEHMKIEDLVIEARDAAEKGQIQ